MSDFLLILLFWIEEKALETLRRVTVMESPPIEHLALD
jgi:hypothetical protein